MTQARGDVNSGDEEDEDEGHIVPREGISGKERHLLSKEYEGIEELKYIPKEKSVRILAYKILLHVKSLKASVEFIHLKFFILKISPVQ